MLLESKDTFLPMETAESDSESDVSMTSADSTSEDENSDMEDQENDSEKEDEDEDELVKAINASKELHRDHPPEITTDEHIAMICFHPVNDIIAVADMVGDVSLYGYTNEETTLKSTIELYEDDACRDIKFSEDGETMFAAGKDKSITLVDVKTESYKAFYENAHDVPVYTMTILSEHLFATGDEEGTVKLWDLRQKSTQRAVFSLKEMEGGVNAMIASNDQRYLVCAGGDGSLTTLNLANRKLHCKSVPYDEEFTCLGLFKANSKILATTNTGKMYVFNWGEFGLHSDEFPNLTKKAINCIVPITDNVVITGGEDGVMRAYSLFPHRRLGIAGQDNFSIECLDICNDGTLMASSSHNNSVKFWNVKYFESLNTAEKIQGGKQKQMKHNLPSSKVNNVAEFFSDL